MLSNALKPIAKAVAAAVTPFVIAGAAKLAGSAGIEIPIDPSWVETAITAGITALAVWATRNRQPI